MAVRDVRARAETVAGAISEATGRSGESNEFQKAARAALERIVPAELIWHCDLDFDRSDASVFGIADADAVRARLIHLIRDDPVMRSFHRLPVPGAVEVIPTTVLSPTRRILEASVAHARALSGQGTRAQMGIITTDPAAHAAGHACGWTFVRTDGRFFDDEIALAGTLQPMLALLEAAYSRTATPPPSTRPRHPRPLHSDGPGDLRHGPNPAPLTPREMEVLQLLSRGLTADHMARVLRIRPATARKHLQNIYAKFDVHDRLLVVEQARRLGLLDP